MSVRLSLERLLGDSKSLRGIESEAHCCLLLVCSCVILTAILSILRLRSRSAACALSKVVF